MASSLTKKLVTKANASKFGRLLATLPTGTPPPSVPNLFRVVDVPNPFDDKIGILGSADAHHHGMANITCFCYFIFIFVFLLIFFILLFMYVNTLFLFTFNLTVSASTLKSLADFVCGKSSVIQLICSF